MTSQKQQNMAVNVHQTGYHNNTTYGIVQLNDVNFNDTDEETGASESDYFDFFLNQVNLRKFLLFSPYDNYEVS